MITYIGMYHNKTNRVQTYNSYNYSNLHTYRFLINNIIASISIIMIMVAIVITAITTGMTITHTEPENFN